jgi:hypothetical protein
MKKADGYTFLEDKGFLFRHIELSTAATTKYLKPLVHLLPSLMQHKFLFYNVIYNQKTL